MRAVIDSGRSRERLVSRPRVWSVVEYAREFIETLEHGEVPAGHLDRLHVEQAARDEALPLTTE